MLSDLLENQIVFDMRELNDDTRVRGTDIECLTAIGTYRNIIGDYVLRSKRVYLFSFQVVNALAFKVGVVLRQPVDDMLAKKETLKGAFCNTEIGYAFFSQGYARHKTKDLNGQKKIHKGVAPGDVVTIAFDTIRGTLSFYINKEFGCQLFVDQKFKSEEFYPALAILGENEKLRLTYYD